MVLLDGPGNEDPLLHQRQLTTQTTLHRAKEREGGKGVREKGGESCTPPTVVIHLYVKPISQHTYNPVHLSLSSCWWALPAVRRKRAWRRRASGRHCWPHSNGRGQTSRGPAYRIRQGRGEKGELDEGRREGEGELCLSDTTCAQETVCRPLHVWKSLSRPFTRRREGPYIYQTCT